MAERGTTQLFKEDQWYELETRLPEISIDHRRWHGFRERFDIGASIIKH